MKIVFQVSLKRIILVESNACEYPPYRKGCMPFEATAGDFKNPEPLGDGVCTCFITETLLPRTLFFLFSGKNVFFNITQLYLMRARQHVYFSTGYLRFYGEATTSSSYGGYGKVIRIPIHNSSHREACTLAPLVHHARTAPSMTTTLIIHTCVLCHTSHGPSYMAEMRTTLTSSSTSTRFPKDGSPTR